MHQAYKTGSNFTFNLSADKELVKRGCDCKLHVYNSSLYASMNNVNSFVMICTVGRDLHIYIYRKHYKICTIYRKTDCTSVQAISRLYQIMSEVFLEKKIIYVKKVYT